MMIYVKNVKNFKPPYKGQSEYVGRPSSLGNPYSCLSDSIAIYKTASREESIEKFRFYLNDKLTNDLNNYMAVAFIKLYEKYKLLTKMGEDLYLLCYCHPESCHADVIAEKLKEWYSKEQNV